MLRSQLNRFSGIEGKTVTATGQSRYWVSLP